MSKKAFKVGDRVRALVDIGCERNTKGIKGTVAYIDSGETPYAVEFDENINGHNLGICGAPTCKDKYGWWCKENEIELCNTSIHITVDGTKVLAVMKEDKQEISRGVATCNPSDEFNFKTGAKLAMDRLLGEEIKGDYITGVSEVSRKAKVGEYIKVVELGNHSPMLKVGDIHKVTYVESYAIKTDKRNLFYDSKQEYAVLENYNPEKAEQVESAKSTETKDEYLSFKKVKRRAEVGEYMLVVNASVVPGDDYKNGDILKCIGFEYGCSRYTKGDIDSRARVLTKEEYVVLEGYQPPKTFEESTERTYTSSEVIKLVEKALEGRN